MKHTLKKIFTFACICSVSTALHAAESFKIGLIVPMTGPFASTGKQIEAAARLYMEQHGDVVDGRKIELILKDDGGVQPELTKRQAQELVINDKVNVLAGFGLTPLAFAAAPIATQAKVPMVVMAASTSSIVEKSPYIVRTSMTEAQVTTPMAEWAAKDPDGKMRTMVTLVSDFGPGLDSEKAFVDRYTAAGGKVLETIRIPKDNPDFSPFMQRVKDLNPEGLFVFLPTNQGITLMKQFRERGLKEAGIQLTSTGGLLDDDLLPSMGDEALGVITSSHYSAAHDSPENKAYVEGFRQLTNNSMRPDLMSVGGYDGMHLIYSALKQAGSMASGDELLEAMKGMSWISPRGPITIDPETRDVVHNVYLRRAEKVGDEIYNIEFTKIDNVRDPGTELGPFSDIKH